jgi:hypothetical protein
MAICPDGHQSTASDYCDVCGLSIGGTVTQTAPSSGGASPWGAAPSSGAGASGGSGGNLGEPCPNCLLPRTDDPFCEGCGYDFATATPVVPPPVTVIANPTPPADPSAGSTPNQNPNLAATTALDLDAELEAAIAAAGSKPTDPPIGSTPVTTPPVAAGADPVTPLKTTPVSSWILLATADRAYYDSVVAEGEIDPNAYPFPPYCPERRFPVVGDTVRVGRSSTVRGTVVEIDLTGPPTDPGVSHLHAVLQARPDGGWTLLDPGSANGTVLNDDTAPIPENHPMPIDDGYRIHLGIWTTLTLVKE